MKSFFWNIRGLNGASRKSSVSAWIRLNRPLLGALLETHVLEENLSGILNTVTPGWRYEANYSEDAENGRIVVVWDPSISVIVYYKSPQMVLCGVFNPVTGHEFSVAFIYARNRFEQRVSLWEKIKELSNSSRLSQSPWIILGDFNQVLSVSEIYSLSQPIYCIQGMEDLNECLAASGVFDLTYRGCYFTWTNKSPTNPKSRKLDRALINEAWLERYPDSNAYFDAPGSSDHSPCLISLGTSTSIRKTRFLYYNMFSSHPDFLKLLEEAWRQPIIPSSHMFSFYQRLRSAKECCKRINRTSFSDIQKRSKEAFAILEDIQRQVLTVPTPQLFEDEQAARASWIFYAAAEESFLHQKSRVRWLTVGDSNTGVFFKYVKANLQRNKIIYLLDGEDRRVYDPTAVKEMASEYFSNLLGSENEDVDPLSVQEIQQLQSFRCDESMASRLCTIPSVQEIKNTVFSLPYNKAPGPDGFTTEFFCSTWNVVGSDMVNVVQDFFRNPSMLRQLNATVITLIPKTPGAAKLSDFRPISLCNTVYKVISKLLSERLQWITPIAVQRNQVGFIKGRLLSENILLAAELVSDFNKPGATTRGCLQIDITKAYDNVDWGFLLNILKALDLPEVFVNWIRLCYTTPYYSVCVNGELVDFFPGKKGLRQGDSLSSSLFVLVMDILSKKLDQAALSNQFTLHPRCTRPLITHLSFADDMLVFFDGSESSLAAILATLTDFHHISGLGLSLSKSCLFVDGGNMVFAHSLAARFGLTQGSLPVRYLGLPLLPHKLRTGDYQPLLDKFRARINSWTVKRLSFAGRLQLLQSVLYGIFQFWAAVFPLPKACIDSLERMCNAFLWNGTPDSARGAKICWESVCTPKKSGGLGLRRMSDLNQISRILGLGFGDHS